MSRRYDFVATLYHQTTGEVIDQYAAVDRAPAPVFVHEFTPASMERIGEPVLLKLIDATVYQPGMDRLCLLVRVNGEDVPRSIAFRNNWQVAAVDLQERTSALKIPFYKSVVLEFDLGCMKGRRL